jgi:hypothetical protein
MGGGGVRQYNGLENGIYLSVKYQLMQDFASNRKLSSSSYYETSTKHFFSNLNNFSEY